MDSNHPDKREEEDQVAKQHLVLQRDKTGEGDLGGYTAALQQLDKREDRNPDKTEEAVQHLMVEQLDKTEEAHQMDLDLARRPLDYNTEVVHSYKPSKSSIENFDRR
jgi:hypothetical protein